MLRIYIYIIDCFFYQSEGTSQEVDVVPPSPSASAIASRRTSISRHSNYSIEVDSAAQRDADKSSPPKGRRKQLLLLTRTTGTQTDPVFILPSSPHPPSMLDEHTPSGTHSETSSLQEGRMSQFSILLDKINNLLHRIAQADVRTLTNRLKRQHLAGADVGHLSRTTISGILNEVSSLRTHFRTILDDERSTTLVSRKEFRALLKVYSELFQEIGSLRATVNEVVLNPQIAIKLRDEAMDSEDKGRAAPKAVGALGGWIAPLSKLWATSSSDTPDTTGGPPSLSPGLMRTGSTRNRLQPPRIAPKLAPAISASTTTVNVEFTNAGIRRAISTTPAPPAAVQVPTERLAPSPLSQNRPQLRGIFVGSSGTATKQTPANKQKDPWAMAPAGGVGSASRLDQAKLRSARPTAGGVNRLASGDKVDSSRRMSRVVDAMVDQHAVDDDDDEGGDFPSNLLQRTLRPRGLSDSSIHSTFIAHGPPLNRMVTPAGLALSSPTMESSVRGITSVGIGGITPWLDRDSVLQSISRKMQSFRFATGSDQLRTKELPDENVPQVNVGAITGSSTPSGTPTASATQLPITGSSPPRPILAQPSRSNTRRVENSLSPIARTPLHDEARRGSPKVAGGLPGITSWANPRLQHVLEGHDEEAMGSYRGSDSTIGRTYARPRGL